MGSLIVPTNRFFCIVQDQKPGTGIDEREPGERLVGVPRSYSRASLIAARALSTMPTPNMTP